MSTPITVLRRYLQAIMIMPRPAAGPARPSSATVINLLPQRSCMWNEPTAEDLARIPRLYSSQDQEWQDHVIYEHFFLGGCDWYVGEYGPEERIFFGYAILNDDLDNSEWGYISFDELREIRTRQGFEIDRDVHWITRKAAEVDRIVEAYRGRRRR